MLPHPPSFFLQSERHTDNQAYDYLVALRAAIYKLRGAACMPILLHAKLHFYQAEEMKRKTPCQPSTNNISALTKCFAEHKNSAELACMRILLHAKLHFYQDEEMKWNTSTNYISALGCEMKLSSPDFQADRPYGTPHISPHSPEANQTMVPAPQLPHDAGVVVIFIFPG